MRRTVVVGALPYLCGLSACTSSTAPITSSFLRAINTSPDAPPLDVYVYGSRVINSLPYGRSTLYIDIGSGPASVDVVTADSASLYRTATNFTAERSYSLFILGRVAKLGVLIVADSMSAPTDSARVRFVNASPSSASVDVYVKPLGAATPSTPTFPAVAFESATPYILTQSMALEVIVASAGSKSVVVDDTLASIPGGAVRTVVTLDHAGGGPPITALNLANGG